MAVVTRRPERAEIIPARHERPSLWRRSLHGIKYLFLRHRAKLQLIPVLLLFATFVAVLMAVHSQWWPFVGLFFSSYAFGLLGGRVRRPRNHVEAQQRVLLVLLVPALLVAGALLLMAVQSVFWPLGGTLAGTYLGGLYAAKLLETTPTPRRTHTRQAQHSLEVSIK